MPVTSRRLDMALLSVLVLLLVLDLVAWRWGYDSRDGHDWRS
jgi:HAMP domain-containing protein